MTYNWREVMPEEMISQKEKLLMKENPSEEGKKRIAYGFYSEASAACMTPAAANCNSG